MKRAIRRDPSQISSSHGRRTHTFTRLLTALPDSHIDFQHSRRGLLFFAGAHLAAVRERPALRGYLACH
jgi:hypothetical protein